MKSDIRIDTGFLSNLKTKRLRRKLGDLGVVCLVKLWSYVGVRFPKGVLVGYTTEDLEEAAGWTGVPGAFASYAIRTRWVDQAQDGTLAVHDWEEHQPYILHSDKRSEAARVAATAKWERYTKRGDNGRRKRGASGAQCGPHTTGLPETVDNPVDNSKSGHLGADTDNPPTKRDVNADRNAGRICDDPNTGPEMVSENHLLKRDVNADRNAPSPDPLRSRTKDLKNCAPAPAPVAPAVAPKPVPKGDPCQFELGCPNRGTVKVNGRWYCSPHHPGWPDEERTKGNSAGKGKPADPVPPRIRALNLPKDKELSLSELFIGHLDKPIPHDDLPARLQGAGLDSNEIVRAAQVFFGTVGKAI